MSLDRFAADYTNKPVSKITPQQIAEARKETKKKDLDFEKQKLMESWNRMVERSKEEARKNNPLKSKYPLVPWGKSMRYDIPANEKAAVINSMDVFKREIPLYDGVYMDIHSDQQVKGCELEVICDDGINYVVSPHYNESGGMLTDLFSEADKA